MALLNSIIWVKAWQSWSPWKAWLWSLFGKFINSELLSSFYEQVWWDSRKSKKSLWAEFKMPDLFRNTKCVFFLVNMDKVLIVTTIVVTHLLLLNFFLIWFPVYHISHYYKLSVWLLSCIFHYIHFELTWKMFLWWFPT